jgi:hypothetical protein
MKTYLTLYFSSEGQKPSEVVDILKKMGFKATRGNYDFVYDWGGNASVDDVVKLGNKVKIVLKKLNVFFKIETI